MQLKQQSSQLPGENILPLVNVVFLLLIFFMLAGAFSRPDMFKIESPIADNDNAADRKIVTVLVNAEGEMAYNDLILDMEDLKHLVAGEVKHNSLITLQLKADANMNAVALIDIMEILKDTGLESIHLLTVSPEKN